MNYTGRRANLRWLQLLHEDVTGLPVGCFIPGGFIPQERVADRGQRRTAPGMFSRQPAIELQG